MSELGDLLEALHQASRRFDRLRIVWRTWHDDERAHAAFIAEVEETRGRPPTPYAPLDPDTPPPPERNGRIRVWFERPGRWREEREGDERRAGLAIRDGRRWWTYDAVGGAMSNEGEEETGANIGDDLALYLDPAPAIGLYDFELLGDGERAGRPVVRARAVPRARDETQDMSFGLSFGAGADEVLLEVDAERGVLLRTEARRDAEPFGLFEAEEAVFDAPHAPKTFTFEPPPGEEVHTWEVYERIHELPLHEAAQRAPFPVFVPTRVPGDWGLAVSYTAPHERPSIRAQVHLWYRAGGGVAEVNVIEEAEADAYPLGGGPGAAEWREQELGDGASVRVRDRNDEFPQAQLVATREGTAISMHSTELDAQALLDLAASLAPAPTQPPELGRSDS